MRRSALHRTPAHSTTRRLLAEFCSAIDYYNVASPEICLVLKIHPALTEASPTIIGNLCPWRPDPPPARQLVTGSVSELEVPRSLPYILLIDHAAT